MQPHDELESFEKPIDINLHILYVPTHSFTTCGPH